MLWASSRMFVFVTEFPAPTTQALDVVCIASDDGIVFAPLDKDRITGRYRFFEREHAPDEANWQYITEVAASHSGVPGFHFWQGLRDAGSALGIRYPAALISLLICYWMARRLGRRRRRSSVR